MDDRQLRRAKKFQAYNSLAGGTLGLGSVAALAARKKDLALKLSIAGSGVGGVGALNFAAISNAESKAPAPRRNVYVVRNKKQIKNIKAGLQPVNKSVGGMMDFGLSDVHQGQNVEVSKSVPLTMPRKRNSAAENKTVANHAHAGQVAAPLAAYYGASAARGGKAGFGLARDLGIPKVAAHAAGLKTAGSAVKGATSFKGMAGTALRHPYLAGGSVIAGSHAGISVGRKKVNQRRLTPVSPVAKADWMNITEHQRRAKDSRQTKNKAKTAAGLGGAGITATYTTHRGFAGPKDLSPGHQALVVSRTLKNAGQRLKTVPSLHPEDRGRQVKLAARMVKGNAVRNPYGAALLGSTALLAGGTATAIGARSNEKHHDRAIGRLRKQREFAKAYSPEAKRFKRLKRTSDAALVTSGAAAVGAGGYGFRAHQNVKAMSEAYYGGRAHEASRVHAVNTAYNTAPGKNQLNAFKLAANHPGGSRGMAAFGKAGRALKGNSAKAGALGVTAVAAKLGSDRIRSYANKGRGKPYKPLYRPHRSIGS